MKTPRIYLDTSVLGGCFEAEFAAWSNGLLDDFRAGRFIPVLSDLLEAELNLAPESVRKVHGELLGLSAERTIVSPEALSLLSATVADADMLVSWNFKHIVRFDKIRMFNAANLTQGYKPLAIHSPREVTTYGQD